MAFTKGDFVIVKNVLVRYKGSDSSVEVPDGVISIGKQAFYFNDSLQSVKLPQSVITIDDEAFSNCKNLQKIELPDGLKEIGCQAFSRCISLKSIVLPHGVKSIRSGAFSNCYNLEEIELPDALTVISSSVFESTAIGEISIPYGVGIIEKEAFRMCSKLKRVVLPDGLKSVGWHAFHNCSELTDITFPTSLNDIAGEAFSGCKGLVREDGFIIINGDLSAYYGEERVITVPEGVKSINESVFQKNTRLAKAILPQTLTSVGSTSFAECTNLREINISPSVTDIAENAFTNCSKLADADGFIIFNKILFGYYGNSAVVIVPDGVETIGTGAFVCAENNKIEEIILPESVDFMQESPFSCCWNLKKVVMPQTMKQLGREAFSLCSSLESVRIPEGVEELKFNTFSGCGRLTEIILPSSLKKIGYMAFENCQALRKVIIPEGVEEIGENQFEECESLREVSIPESVKTFGDCDMKGIRLNVRRAGREFKVVLQHRWDERDEKLLWKMMNEPAMKVFDSIKTPAYKVALAERLYPEYEEYGDFLQKNMHKAVRDAIEFDDEELLEALRAADLIDQIKFDKAVLKEREEKAKRIEAEYKKAEETVLDEKVINIDYLKNLAADLEEMSKYRDTGDLLKLCYEKIESLEERTKQRKYDHAVKTMNEFGGMSRITLGHAIKEFGEIRGFRDADELAQECERRLGETRRQNQETIYQKALELLESYDGSNRDTLETAIDAFERLSGYKDSDQRLRDYYKEFWNMDI